MKKKFVVAFVAVFVLGLVAAAYAYNRTATKVSETTHSCPMKNRSETASADKKDSCCGMADCCKDGICKMNGECCKDHDACPMKDKMKSEKQSADYSKITFSDDAGKDCCATGAACCTSGGACCKGKHS